MGYVCPVCEDPQSDAEHLANHLAFTAMLGDDGHEAWLDDHAPDWADANPAELAPRVAEHAEETDFPQVFEDTTEGGGGHAHDHQHGHGDGQQHDNDGGHQPGDRDGVAGGSVDGAPGGVADPDDAFPDDGAVAPEDVLAEARELTRERRANAAGDADEGAGDDADDE